MIPKHLMEETVNSIYQSTHYKWDATTPMDTKIYSWAGYVEDSSKGDSKMYLPSMSEITQRRDLS